MILNFYLRDEGWKWWYLLLIPVGIATVFFEIFYVYRGEQQAAFDVHPYMPTMRDGIEKIKEEVKGLNANLERLYAAQNKAFHSTET